MGKKKANGAVIAVGGSFSVNLFDGFMEDILLNKREGLLDSSGVVAGIA